MEEFLHYLRDCSTKNPGKSGIFKQTTKQTTTRETRR